MATGDVIIPQLDSSADLQQRTMTFVKGSLIVGGNSGVLEILNVGALATNKVLTVTNGDGTLGWVTPTSGMTNPMTTAGDIIKGGTLGIGTAKQVLRTNSGATAPEWANNLILTKSIAVELPTNAEDIGWFYTDIAITVTKLAAVLVGSSTPSVTWTVRHSTDRSATGNEVVTSGTTTTSVTTGSVVTSFNDATIPADSWVWLETTAKSGTVNQIIVSLEYTED
jgi:hypothetical protein